MGMEEKLTSYSTRRQRANRCEARKLVEYGLSKGYKTDKDFTDADIKELFGIEQ